MIVLTNIAHKLIKIAGNVLTNHVGIIDLDGMIIVHSNQQLIGAYSQPALRIIKNEEKQIVVDETAESNGSLPGVYLPIVVDGKLRCVLLVQYGTQQPDELLQTCKLLAEICRLTISESLSSDYLNFKTYDRTTFLIDWLKDSYKNQRENFFVKAREYGLNPGAGVTVAILRIYRLAFNHALFYSLSETLIRMGLLTVVDENDFVLIFNTTDKLILSKHIESMNTMLAEMAPNHLLTIGSAQKDSLMIHESYSDAKIMLNTYYGVFSDVLFYEDCILDICLSKAQSHYKETLIDNVFGDCSGKEIIEFCNFIKTYFEYNGSINAIAQKSFTHKNTVQYRIERIKKKTGFDLRNLTESFNLYVAAFWASRTFNLTMAHHSLEDSRKE